MSEVAKAAGVSVMTVSNVINDRPKVGIQTRARVLEVIDRLGYEVDLRARGLRAGRNDTIALVVPRYDHPYFGELSARFASTLAPHGKHLVVEQSGANPEGELSAVARARLRMYDGVLLSVVGLGYGDVDRLRAQVPIVLLGEQRMPPRFDHISMANVDGGRLATEYLLGRGCRRIAVLGGPGPAEDTIGMKELRAQGWREAHAGAGLVPDERLLVPLTEHEPAPAREALGRRLADGLQIDAVFAVTDEVAIGALAALHAAGRRVPDDVQVIGFDNLEFSSHAVPGLTSVDPHNEWIVARASELLLERIAGADGPPRQEHSPVSLAVRGSTRP